MPYTFPSVSALPVKRSDTKSKDAKLVQELVSLAGFALKPDGLYGLATETAVKALQANAALPQTGIVDQATLDALIAPFTRATAPQPVNGRTLPQLMAAYATQHLNEHPREYGGQNSGPWVRLYMDGHEGAEWAWCAGFACSVLKQACDTLGVAMPIKKNYGCDELAASAKQANRFLPEKQAVNRKNELPGSFFLARKNPTDWTHVGIVAASEPGLMRTVEGNTNDSGDFEGYEVCARFRGYLKMDFILLG